jgi:hypothetical protein
VANRPERRVSLRVRRTCRVELVGMIEASRVVVGREQRQKHGFTGNDRDAGQLDLICCPTRRRGMHRWLERQNLLNEISDSTGFRALNIVSCRGVQAPWRKMK